MYMWNLCIHICMHITWFGLTTEMLCGAEGLRHVDSLPRLADLFQMPRSRQATEAVTRDRYKCFPYLQSTDNGLYERQKQPGPLKRL